MKNPPLIIKIRADDNNSVEVNTKKNKIDINKIE